MESPEIEVESQEIEVESQEIEVETPKIEVEIPEMETPKVENEIPEVETTVVQAKTTSLKDKLKQQIQEEKKKAEEKPIVENDFSLEEVQTQISDIVHRGKEHRLVAVLRNVKIEIEGHRVIFTVKDNLQQNILWEKSKELTDFLQKNLHNNQLTMELLVEIDNNHQTQVFSAPEKFEAMKNKNPLLADFRRAFEAEIGL